MKYINLTKHAINLSDGRAFEPSGQWANVESTYGTIVDDVAHKVNGAIQNLPDPVEGVRYIVSGVILDALNGSRDDVVGPASDHPDTVRNEKGHVVSVPCFRY